MSLDLDPSRAELVPVRPAATVLLVRDADPSTGGPGIEICMLQRNLRSDFVGGAFVFPGGGVDPVDGEPEVEVRCVGLSDEEASARLGLPSNGLAFWVAAIRESFEEAGLLAARRADGSPLRLDDPQVAARFVEHRRSVDRQERRLIEVCEEEDLVLEVGRMHYFGHWVTPPGAPRRYDTRFFLAAAPEGQVALHDDREVIATEWVRPDAALAAHAQGTFAMLPPTVASLRSLLGYTCADEAIAAAAALTEVPMNAPRILADGDVIRIVLHGEPGYDDAYAGETKITAWPEAGSRARSEWTSGRGVVHRPVATEQVLPAPARDAERDSP